MGDWRSRGHSATSSTEWYDKRERKAFGDKSTGETANVQRGESEKMLLNLSNSYTVSLESGDKDVQCHVSGDKVALELPSPRPATPVPRKQTDPRGRLPRDRKLHCSFAHLIPNMTIRKEASTDTVPSSVGRLVCRTGLTAFQVHSQETKNERMELVGGPTAF